MDDSTLLRRFAENRQEADFAELVNRHVGLVYRLALRRVAGDSHLAEDIAQQVFTVLAQRAFSVQHHPVLQGWLYVTTCHLASKALRGEIRRRHREEEASAMNETHVLPGNEPEADLPRLRVELGRVLDALPERDRDAVLLRFYSNRTYSEIGAVLKVSENAARQRVDRALERMHRLFARRKIVSTSAALAALLAGEAAAAVPNSLATTITSAALAGGTTLAVSTGFIAFMSTTKMLAVAGAMACIVAGYVLFESGDAGRLHARSAALQQLSESAQRELAGERLRAGQLKKQNDELLEKRDALKKQLAERTMRKKVVAKSMNLLMEHLMYSDPEYRRRWLEQTRIGLRKRYAFLYRKLKLSPQQIEEFENAQYAAQQSAVAVRAAIMVQGIVPGDPAFDDIAMQETQSVKETLERKVQALWGDEGLAAYTAFESRPVGITAPLLAMDLFYSATPLSTDQMFRFEELIIANSSKEKKEADWEKIFNESQGLLQPPQLDALKRRVERQAVSRQMQELRKKLTSGMPN